MKKWLFILCFLLLPCAAWGQGTPYAVSPPAPNSLISVCNFPATGNPCTNTATISGSVTLSPALAQPFLIGAGGNFLFYVGAGTYQIQITGRADAIVSIGGGGGSVSGLSANCIPKAATATTITGCSSVTDNGTVVATNEPISTGASPPTLTPGTAGAQGWSEGTTPTVFGASADFWWASSANHCFDEFANSVEKGCAALGAVTIVTGADWTCGTGGTNTSCVAAQTISNLTFTLPLGAINWTVDCDGVVGQATAATANSWNIQTATNGATNLTAWYDMYTAATAKAGGAVTDVASTTTTQVIAPTWTLGGTATKMPFHISATVEGASVSGTVVNIQLVAPTVADLVTIYRGTVCKSRVQ